ncbi:MAG: hypothetical protein EPO39_18845 [Candidatus Manganitrophaceae bacterium]|nr:MAG: hypothetical protein EPO39_18845 [Candidatus Manganitrophaceae bacterium]
MKKFVFFLFLMSILPGCGGGGGRSDPAVTIILRGILTNGVALGGQNGGGNPAQSGTVTISSLGKTATITQANPGAYSITDVPVGGNYTVVASEPNNPLADVTCGISIPDSTTITVDSQTNGTCVAGTGNIGELILNITTN